MALTPATSTLLRRAAALQRPLLPLQQSQTRQLHGKSNLSTSTGTTVFLGALVGVPSLLLYAEYVKMREKVEIIGGRLQRVSSRWL